VIKLNHLFGRAKGTFVLCSECCWKRW